MNQVPVGPSTIAGFTTAIIGGIYATVALTTGDHTEATIGAVTGGAVAAVSLVTTLAGRYAQAKELIRKGATLASDISKQVLEELDNPDGESEDAPHAKTVEVHGELNG